MIVKITNDYEDVSHGDKPVEGVNMVKEGKIYEAVYVPNTYDWVREQVNIGDLRIGAENFTVVRDLEGDLQLLAEATEDFSPSVKHAIEQAVCQELAREHKYLVQEESPCVNLQFNLQDGFYESRYFETKAEVFEYLLEWNIKVVPEWKKVVTVDRDEKCQCEYMARFDISLQVPRPTELDEIGIVYKTLLRVAYTEHDYTLPPTCRITASESHPVITCRVGE